MAKVGYFFDLDGTLVDTHQSNASAYLHAIYDVLPEVDISRGDLLREIMAGKNYKVFLKNLIPSISSKDIEEVSRRKSEVYPSYLSESRLNTSLIASIHSWREDAEAIIVLVTTAKECNARCVLEHHGISSLFDYAVFGDQVAFSKPNPEIYLKALGLAAVDAKHAHAFEDSESGIAAAKAAGIEVTRVVWDI